MLETSILFIFEKLPGKLCLIKCCKIQQNNHLDSTNYLYIQRNNYFDLTNYLYIQRNNYLYIQRINYLYTQRNIIIHIFNEIIMDLKEKQMKSIISLLPQYLWPPNLVE